MAFAMTFATPLVLARVFDQAAFGTYKQLFLVYGTIAAIAQLGMADSLLYFLASTPDRGGRYVLNSLLALAGSGLACLGLLAVAGPVLAHWLGNGMLSGLSGLLGAYVLLMLPATVLEIVMIARRHYGNAGLVYGLSDLVKAVALVVPAVVTRRLEWLLAGGVAFGAIRLGGTLLYLAREYAGELRTDRMALRRQLAYGLPLQLGVGLWILVQSLHYYIVAAGVDAATYAIYAVGCLQIPIIDMLSTPSKNLLTARMREAVTADQSGAALALWHDTTRRLALVFFPLAGLLVATARDLIPVLFTDRYAASIPILMVWSLIAPAYAAQPDGVLAVYAETRAIAVVHAIQLLLMTVLVLAFIRLFGLVGAVLGTVLVIWVGKVLMLLRARRLLRVTLAALLPWRSLGIISGAAAASALIAVEVNAHLAVGQVPALILTSGACVVTYVGILVLCGFIDLEARPGRGLIAVSPLAVRGGSHEP